MKILRIEAENIKKLKVVAITPSGAVVQITGANGSGKTSVLDAIYYALGGTKDVPTQPIRRGQKTARVKLDLGEYTVTRKFTEAGTTLIVESPNGARFSSPQRLLDEILGRLTFDPLAFSRMDPKHQLEQIRSMVTLNEDIDELDAMNAEEFSARTEASREWKQLDAQIMAIDCPDDTPDDEADISELAKELEEAGKFNNLISDARLERLTLEAKAVECGRRAEDARTNARKLRDSAAKFLKDAQALDDAAILIETDAIQYRQTAAGVVVPAPKNTQAIHARISDARVINARVQAKHHKEKLLRDASAKRLSIDAMTRKMQERMDRKQQAIASAKMPIPGLSFGDGEVLYDGLPLTQASSAEQLRISVAVAMAANPKLRVLRIQDGSLLDGTSMELLAEMAAANDMQIWIERVSTDGKVGIVMEDGMVKEDHYAPSSKSNPNG